MIILQQNSNNLVTTKVSDLQIGTGSLFLWEFIQGVSHQKIYTLAYNSSSVNRYDSFSIQTVSNSASVTASAGQIYAPLLGNYEYNVYESPSGSYSPIGLTKCGTGKMIIQSGSAPVIAYTGSTQQYIIYGK